MVAPVRWSHHQQSGYPYPIWPMRWSHDQQGMTQCYQAFLVFWIFYFFQVDCIKRRKQIFWVILLCSWQCQSLLGWWVWPGLVVHRVQPPSACTWLLDSLCRWRIINPVLFLVQTAMDSYSPCSLDSCSVLINKTVRNVVKKEPKFKISICKPPPPPKRKSKRKVCSKLCLFSDCFQ